MRKIFLIVLIASCFSSFSQDSTFTISAGGRFKKYVGFYMQNGISAEFSSSKILNKKVSFGLNIVSSKLGTALLNNAIPTLEVELSAIKYFRVTKKVNPFVRLNTGFASANFGDERFDNITNKSALLSVETGVKTKVYKSFDVLLGGGLNAITGNGFSNLGTIYPLYYQISLMYRIK
jgi:hypothetical protein